MAEIEINNIKLFYKLFGDWENTSKEIIVLISGLTRDHTIWADLIKYFEHEYRILVFDNRGSGRTCTEDSDYSIARMSQDAISLIKQLKLGPVNIVGHSMGGFIAMHVASQCPEMVDQLFLCSTSIKTTDSSRAYIQDRINLINSKEKITRSVTIGEKDDILNAMRWLYSKNFLSDQNKVNAVLERELNNLIKQSSFNFKKQAVSCLEHDATTKVVNIVARTTVIYGESDPFFNKQVSQELSDAIKDSNLVCISSASHMVQIEAPYQLYRIIDTELKKNIEFNEMNNLLNIPSPMNISKRIEYDKSCMFNYGYGNFFPSTININLNKDLALYYRYLGNMDASEKVLRKVLDFQIRQCSHLPSSFTMISFANLRFDSTKSIQLLNKAARIQLKAYGENSNKLALLNYSYGNFYRKNREDNKARLYYERAKFLFTETYGAKHPYVSSASKFANSFQRLRLKI